MLVRAEGIVLRQNKISGGRRIIHIFTKEYGLISVGTNINERSKKKSALGIRPFTYAVYDLFKNKGYYNLNNLEVKKSYYSIGEDVDKYINASYVLEYLFKALQEEQPNPKIFNLTIDFFNVLTDTKADPKTLSTAYIVKSFVHLGVKPQINSCALCGSDEVNNIFSIKDGGIICGTCHKNQGDSLIFTTDFDIVNVLQYFIKNPLKSFTKIKLKPDVFEELRKILGEYSLYYLDVENILSDKLIDNEQ